MKRTEIIGFEDQLDNEEWQTSEGEMIRRLDFPVFGTLARLKIKPNLNYKMIKMSLGDPSAFGNFNPTEEMSSAVINAVKSANGYSAIAGNPQSLKAVAKYMKQFMKYEPDIKNIALTNGCTGALEIAMAIIADRGDNILVARFLPIKIFS